MARTRVEYVCAECGANFAKWQGRCPNCSAWTQIVETVAADPRSSGGAGLGSNLPGGRRQALVDPSAIQTLDAIDAVAAPRATSGIDEFDRVLGGGIVAGAMVLIGGDPGIGKSTLLLQSLASLCTDVPALYVTGEESAAQVALRARRLGMGERPLPILAETQLERIATVLAERKPRVVVIDSIQTLFTDLLPSAPGSVAQVRECAAQLTRIAKREDITIFLVGHVTKEGQLAGPRVLEHIVDCVLYFEGDTHSSFRLVRATKNRFGAVNELGVFAMTDRGLRGVANPSALFLSQHDRRVAGSCIVVTQEGTRPLLVEIQALVDTAHAPNPRRLSVGLEANRLAMLLAVAHRHAGLVTFDQDVFVNAVGGVRIDEPASDLAVLLAIVSSLRNRPLGASLEGNMAVFGEIGLAGEIRPAPRGQERLREAAKLGFSRIIVPKANAPRGALAGLPDSFEIIAVERVEEALEIAFAR
jgi:DNA repair protein RadA/Sms